VPAHEDDKPLRPGSRAGRGEPGSAQDALSQVAFLEQEIALLRRRSGRDTARQPRSGGSHQRAPGHGFRPDRQERAPGGHPARRAGPDPRAQGGDRQASPAAERLRRLPGGPGGRHRRHLHRRTQAPGRRRAGRGARGAAARTRGHAQRGAQHHRRARLREGRRDRLLQGAARGRRARARGRAHRRGEGGAPRRAAARLGDPGRRRAAARAALRLRLRAGAQVRGRGARARGGPGHRLRRHRRPDRADRADPRRGRAALPAQGAVPRARAASRRKACCSTALPAAARR
jgi:hypothetical protein